MTRPCRRRKVKNPRSVVSRRVQNKHYKKKIIHNAIVREDWNHDQTLLENYKQIGLRTRLNDGLTKKSVADAVSILNIDQIEELVEQGQLVDKTFEVENADNSEPTPVVKKLEEKAERLNSAKTEKYFSLQEIEFIKSMIKKHGGDFKIKAMEKDKKLNVWQNTARQLEKKVTRFLSLGEEEQ
ncbi:Ribosome biogenesis protein Nop16 domain-containing protein [Rozella allomycis CSF55]|uniref:Nucleolar protein 16 n=1 Tax=Rozella allomycis (strain CSF55) TaxID=988480 RepID=A0A075AUG6_ROZAC|nr:Ribosome biogenesis protein Nop16 domain-containing protein [Rozella allomycis CSF55]|eukprot:EPZ33805.1 Ribosome biogenesis protein Nop16 domain-containing protein [Rozella allomycis CSF55]